MPAFFLGFFLIVSLFVSTVVTPALNALDQHGREFLLSMAQAQQYMLETFVRR